MQLVKKCTVEAAVVGITCSLLFGNVGLGNTQAADGNRLNRSSDPVVITGGRLPSLKKAAIERIVGFSYENGWEQIPIQIDERKYVDFMRVYNGSPCGYGTIAYVDPNTYVGPDENPRLDMDDELVFMARDSGDPAPLPGQTPAGVLENSCVEIKLQDPLDGTVGYVYLFESDGSLRPDAGGDYVSYKFRLIAGSYIPNYRKTSGPNPEDSEAYSAYYRTHFSDRWIADELQIFAGSASGVDILDRHKTGRGPGDCSRSENTASDGEGVFFTNKDGCVRAIRSYMGYNSGPYIQRDHFFYQQRHDISLYWRCHVATGGRDVHDYSPDAVGMTYYNDINPQGVLIDGQPDNVKLGSINWEMVTGKQGTLIVCHSMDTDIPFYKTSSYYSDDQTPELTQCTGDEYEFGVSGVEMWNWPNTDPTLGAYNNLTLHRTVYYDPPSEPLDMAIVRHQEATTPLGVVITPLNALPPLPIFVDDDAPNDAGRGDPALSDPLEDGSADHPGTYTGDGNRDIRFLGKEITVRSLDPNNSRIRAQTVIDCQGTVLDHHRGFVFDHGESSESVLAGLTITNAYGFHGGGICCLNSSSPTIAKCLLQGNTAARGGGMYNEGGSPAVLNCIFSGNTADNGGGLYNSSSARVINCTFYNNTAMAGRSSGGGLQSGQGDLTIANCIVWNNRLSQIQIDGGTITVTYSNIQGGFAGAGNLTADPLFADPANGDYHLKSQAGRWDPLTESWVIDGITSPCIDTGDPSSLVGGEPEPNGGRVNMGAYGGTAEASTSP